MCSRGNLPQTKTKIFLGDFVMSKKTPPIVELTEGSVAPESETVEVTVAPEAEDVVVAESTTDDLVVADEVAPADADVTEAEVEETESAPVKKSKFSIYSIIALALTILPIALISVLSSVVITPKGTANASILTAILSTFGVGNLTIATGGALGTLYTILLYLVVAGVVANVAFMVVSLISGEKAKTLSRVIALVNFWVYIAYALFVLCTVYYRTYNPVTKKGTISLDLVSLINAFVSLIVFAVLTVKELKAKAIVPMISFVLSSIISICYLGGMIFVYPETTHSIMGRTDLHRAMYITMLACVAAVFTFSLIRMLFYKLKVLDLICFALNAIMAVGVVVVGSFIVDGMDKFATLVIAALAVSVAQVIISMFDFKKEVKEKKEAVALAAPEVTEEETTTLEEALESEVAPEATEVETTTVEEVCAEPVAEEPATPEVLAAEPVVEEVPVEELPVVEPVAPRYEEPAPRYEAPRYAAPAPRYAPRYEEEPITMVAFDWFLDSLTREERAEFQELFVFKYLGGTAVLPEYVPGGNNREFFHAFFCNLGKYRNRISDELLEKMYQYMQKRY